jgi:hypothetical protein
LGSACEPCYPGSGQWGLRPFWLLTSSCCLAYSVRPGECAWKRSVCACSWIFVFVFVCEHCLVNVHVTWLISIPVNAFGPRRGGHESTFLITSMLLPKLHWRSSILSCSECRNPLSICTILCHTSHSRLPTFTFICAHSSHLTEKPPWFCVLFRIAAWAWLFPACQPCPALPCHLPFSTAAAVVLQLLCALPGRLPVCHCVDWPFSVYGLCSMP